MQELSGYWEGYFIYGLGFELPFFGERVKMNAQLTFDDSEITGTLTEEKGPFSTGKTVAINGYIEDFLISLEVQYSTNPVILEDGLTTEEIEHDFTINYNGTIDFQKKAINGLWYMENEIESHLDLEIPPAEGLWVLKKVNKPQSDFDYSLLGL